MSDRHEYRRIENDGLITIAEDEKENWTDLNRNGSKCEMPMSPKRMPPKWSYLLHI